MRAVFSIKLEGWPQLSYLFSKAPPQRSAVNTSLTYILSINRAKARDSVHQVTATAVNFLSGWIEAVPSGKCFRSKRISVGMAYPPQLRGRDSPYFGCPLKPGYLGRLAINIPRAIEQSHIYGI